MSDGSRFVENSTVICEAIASLESVLQTCQNAYYGNDGVPYPVSGIGVGNGYNELDRACMELKMAFACLGFLTVNSIEYLGGTSEMFDMSDISSARHLRETTGNSSVIFGEGSISGTTGRDYSW